MEGKLFDLAVGEQTVIGKLNDCVNMADMNVFLEDYLVWQCQANYV